MAEITDLLHAVSAGESAAARRLFELVYADLKRIAHNRLAGNPQRSELDTTSLVHECFVRLRKRGELDAADRLAFFGYVGRVMRSVVVDHVREQYAQKRGGDATRVTLTGVAGDASEVVDAEQLFALDAALDALERVAPDYHRLVELRYFAGLSVQAIADLNGTSTRTVTREWTKARAFLRRLIDENANQAQRRPP